jgi:hypothetical protein
MMSKAERESVPFRKSNDSTKCHASDCSLKSNRETEPLRSFTDQALLIGTDDRFIELNKPKVQPSNLVSV